MTYKIKLQPGDYCRRDSMTEEQYRECAQRFFDSGCPEGEKVGSWIHEDYFGWHRQGGFYHADSCGFGGRELTYFEIMEKEPMQDIWKDAPEGAEYYSEENQLFYKKVDRLLYFWRLNWVESDYDADEYHFLKLIPRPTQYWHKNNELPPIGSECEFFIPNHISQSKSSLIKSGTSVEILFHFNAQGRGVAAYKFMVDGEVRIDYAISDCFRQLKSDREKAIREIKDIVVAQGWLSSAGTVSGEIAEMIYDAGYRKVE